MSIDQAEIAKLATLARISISPEQSQQLSERLGDILDMVSAMQNVDTSDVRPMANPHDAHQRLRPDVVTETDQRQLLQSIAPQVEDGLYLVPKVIE